MGTLLSGKKERAELNKELGEEAERFEYFLFLLVPNLLFLGGGKLFLWMKMSYFHNVHQPLAPQAPREKGKKTVGSELLTASRNSLLCHACNWPRYAWWNSYHVISIQGTAFYWWHTFCKFNLAKLSFLKFFGCKNCCVWLSVAANEVFFWLFKYYLGYWKQIWKKLVLVTSENAWSIVCINWCCPSTSSSA